MVPFIRVTEIWIPSKDRTSLEFGSGSYGGLDDFQSQSHQTVFAFGEGLPGRAWEARRPIVLKDLQTSYFKRGPAAAVAGLTCGLALPIFAGDVLLAVVTFFCGDDAETVGSIEVWVNDPATSSTIVQEDGYYGNAEFFARNARALDFGKGQGLPGEVWASGLPVVRDEPYSAHRFLRKAEALKLGRTTAFALPCTGDRTQTRVMTFLSALDTPIARRFEVWHLRPEEGRLAFGSGLCMQMGDLSGLYADLRLAREDGTLGRILTTNLPAITEDLSREPSVIADSLRAAGMTTLVAIPIVSDAARLTAVAAWYF